MPLRVAVVGLGVGKTHVGLFQQTPGAELAAVCDVNESLAREQAEGAGVAAYTSYERMLGEAELDAVSLCTPPRLHASMAGQAAPREAPGKVQTRPAEQEPYRGGFPEEIAHFVQCATGGGHGPSPTVWPAARRCASAWPSRNPSAPASR